MKRPYAKLSDADLWSELGLAQLVQKRYPPTSREWKEQSKKIHALAAENKHRYGPRRRTGNPARLERCVRKVRARARRGKRKVRSAYAVCQAALKKRRRRRSNPAWYIHAQKMGVGPVLVFNGKSFSNSGARTPLSFITSSAAMSRARGLLGKYYHTLSRYKIWVAEKVGGASQERRRVNPDAREKLDEASRKLQDFTGRAATHVERGRSRSSEKTGLVIGELDLIGYRAKREGVEGGRLVRYGHKFRAGSRPLLAVSTDGKQLHVVGGRYEFTEAGIEDR